tara:strand:+ start:948 stop:3275 length:2328 start_codon:yes stop_codon:yes gene_type:complete
MADTTTTNLNLTKPEIGGAEDTWGVSINSNLDTIDALFGSSGSTVNFGSVQVSGTNGVNIQQGAISIKNGGTQSRVDFYCESSNAHYARLQAPAHSAFSGNVTLTLPASTGSLVGTGDSGTVTNTMLAGSIANAKLANSSATLNSQTLTLGGSLTLDTDNIGEGSSNLYFTNERVDDRVNALLVAGSNITLTYDDAGNTLTIAASGGGSGTVTEAFKTISVSGQDNIVADSATDTLTVAAGSGITLTTNASTDTLTITNSGSASNSFETIAVSGQSNVVADSGTDTLTLVAGSNMTITTDASTDTITFASTASGGSGGSSSSFTKNTFTGDGSTTAFTLSKSVSNEDNLIVFIDAAYQADNVYSVSGTTLTFATAPVNTRLIEVFIIEGGIVGTAPVIDTMTGDGSDTTLALSTTPASENQTFVTIDGVVQHKSTYSVSGSTLTFSEAPPNGSAVECITFVNVALATFQDADGDTKIQLEESADEDKIRFDTAGSERMVIDNSGNVGIGITPTSKLTIFGTGAGNARVQIEGEGGADPYINFLANNAQHWSLGIDDSDSDKFKISEHSALGTNDYFVVDTSGNVGIGTTSPDRNFHVKGSSATVAKFASTGNNVYIELNAADQVGGDAGYIAYTNTKAMGFWTDDTERMRIDSSGTLFVGGTAHYSGGSNADDATLAVNGSIIRTGVQVTDFDEAYVSSSRGILEGTSTYQASNSPLTDHSGAGNFFHLTAKTTATSGSASNNYILQVAYGLTGLQYTRYSSNNGSTWSDWLKRT